MRYLLLAAAAAAALLAAAPPAQAADSPACPGPLSSVWALDDVPTTVVAGARYTLSEYIGIGTITLESVDGRPLSHPFTYTSTTSTRVDVPIILEAGDPPAQIRLVRSDVQTDPATNKSIICTATGVYGPINVVPMPPCPTEDAAAYTVSAPERLARGRTASLVVDDYVASLATGTPPTVTIDGAKVAEDTGKFPVAFAKGKSRMTYSVAWLEDSGKCSRTVEGDVRRINGSTPRIGAKGSNLPTLHAVLPAHCTSAATGRITFQVRSAGYTRTAVLDDQCAGWAKYPSRSQPRSWTAIARSNGEDEAATFKFQLRKAKRNFTQKFAYRVTWHGKTLRSGHVIGVNKYRRGYRVYSSNFDAYWNTCVNGAYDVFADGGRVYCFVEPVHSLTYRFVK